MIYAERVLLSRYVDGELGELSFYVCCVMEEFWMCGLTTCKVVPVDVSDDDKSNEVDVDEETGVIRNRLTIRRIQVMMRRTIDGC